MSSPAGDSTLTRIGVTGTVNVADLGTTLPVGLAAWPTGWVALGWISSDGVIEQTNETSTDFIPWQSNSPVRTEVTKGTTTYKFTAWESSFDTISLFYRKHADDMVAVGSGATAAIQFDEGGKPQQDLRAMGFDIIDGVKQRRFILPNAAVTDRGNVTYKADAMIGYEFTVTAYDDQATGYAVRRMFNEGWSIPA